MRRTKADHRRAGWRLVVALIAIATGIALIVTSLHPWAGRGSTGEEVSSATPTASITQATPSTPPPTEPSPSTPAEDDRKPARQPVVQTPAVPSGEIISVEVRTASGAIVVPKALASGAISPESTSHCHAATTCYDPPYLNKVAWAAGGALPSFPQDDTVYVLGHSCRHCQAVFNNLMSVKTGDQATVVTTKGTFTYVVYLTEDIPFADVAGRKDIWGVEPFRLVMMTCHPVGSTDYAGARTVSAKLKSATLASGK